MREKEREREKYIEREKQRKLGRKDRGASPVHSAIALQTLISEGASTFFWGAEMKDREGALDASEEGPRAQPSRQPPCRP